jgi:hypothetical protein
MHRRLRNDVEVDFIFHVNSLKPISFASTFFPGNMAEMKVARIVAGFAQLVH